MIMILLTGDFTASFYLTAQEKIQENIIRGPDTQWFFIFDP